MGSERGCRSPRLPRRAMRAPGPPHPLPVPGGAWLNGRGCGLAPVRAWPPAEAAPMAEQRVSRWYFGGLASSGAACCTHPLDLLKVKRGHAVGRPLGGMEGERENREAAVNECGGLGGL